MNIPQPLMVCCCVFLAVLAGCILLYTAHCISRFYDSSDYYYNKIQEIDNSLIYYKGDIYEKKDRITKL